MANSADIVCVARGWLGTPFRHQASLKGVGTDCLGLVHGVARELGLVGELDPKFRGYGRTPDPRILLAGCDAYMTRVPITDAAAGDVLIMRFDAEPQHFAIMSDPHHIIHAYAVARRVVEHRLDALWAARIVRAYRIA